MAQAGTSGAASVAPRALWGGHECGSSVLGILKAVKSSSVGFVLKFIAPTMVLFLPKLFHLLGGKALPFILILPFASSAFLQLVPMFAYPGLLCVVVTSLSCRHGHG